MRKLAFCAHFRREDDHLDSTPPKSKHQLRRHDMNTKNPYSTRGLDKFSALLADLDEKRRSIYSQSRLDGKDIVLVQFAYNDSDTCVPIVVKLRRKEKEDKSTDSLEKSAIDSSTAMKATVEARQESDKTTKEKRVAQQSKVERRGRPSSTYLTLTVIMILAFLAVFGKPFSILCTGLAWYLVPALKRRPKRADQGRKITTETLHPKNLISPNTERLRFGLSR